MKKTVLLTMILLLTAGSMFAGKVGTLTEIINPFLMDMEGQQMYIVEGTKIYIYSLEDFSLQKTFGKKGEGPGEFRTHPLSNMGSVVIEAYPKHVVVNSIGRVSFFTRDGKFIKEIKTTGSFGGFKPLGENFVGYGSAVEDKISYTTLKTFNSAITESKQIFKQEGFLSRNRQLIKPLYMVGPFFYICDDKIFVEKDKDSISVFDKSGKFLYSIDVNKGYKKPEVTEADRKMYHDYFRTDKTFKEYYEMIKGWIKIPDTYPGIRYFLLEDSKIYIIRWKGQENKSEIWVYDLKGKFLKKAFVPFYERDGMFPYPYTIKHGKIYQLVEDEEDEDKWDLHMTKIE